MAGFGPDCWGMGKLDVSVEVTLKEEKFWLETRWAYK